MSVVGFSQNEHWEWAHAIGGPNDDMGGNVKIDKHNRLLVTGMFKSPFIKLGTDTLVSEFASTYYLAKMSTDEEVLWAVTSNTGGSLKMDSAGNIYQFGRIFGNYISQGDTLVPGVPQAIYSYYISKRDSNGNLLFLKQWVSGGTLNVNSVAVDATGNSYVVGTVTSDSLTVNGTVIYDGDLLVIKFDAAGNLIWGRGTSYTSSGAIEGQSAVCDAAGNLYVGGSINADSMRIDNVSFPHPGMFLLKLTPDGDVVWLNGVQGYTYLSNLDLTIDKDNNLYAWVSSWLMSGIVLDGDSFAGIHNFLIKYDTDGNSIWHTSARGAFGGLNNTIDAEGNIIVTGTFSGNWVIFGNDTLFNYPYSNNVYVAKYNAAGTLTFLTGTYNDQYYTVVSGFTADREGNFYVSGSFSDGLITFGSIPVLGYNNTKYDMFFAKLSNTFVSDVGAISNMDGSFNLFPNPCVSGMHVLSNSLDDNQLYTIYSINGNKLLSGRLYDSASWVDVSKLSAGVYFFQLTTNGNSTVKRFVIQN